MAEGLIYQAIPKVMKAIGFIAKGRKNQAQNYVFRGIDDVYAAAQPALIEAGVFIVPEVIEQTREERTTKSGATMMYTILRVKHTFYGTDGSSVCAVTVGEAMDSGDKSANKAMSAAMKYAVLEVFAVPTEGDNDTENHSPTVMGKAEIRTAQLDEAFQAAEFDDTARKRLITSTCMKHKVRTITDLSDETWNGMLAAIVDGKCEHFKKAPEQRKTATAA